MTDGERVTHSYQRIDFPHPGSSPGAAQSGPATTGVCRSAFVSHSLLTGSPWVFAQI
jgi:hypothetical protein